MGKSIYDGSPRARKMMEDANDILGFRLTDIMFGEDAEVLKATAVTQPAVFLHSVTLALCTPDLPAPDMTAGHSLGEYSALVAAGALEFEDALRLVSVRAAEMQKCCTEHPGKMAAIIGLRTEDVEQACLEAGATAANYNSDMQLVISGSEQAVEQACSICKEKGARRALMLNVGGAFHSPLMEPARIELGKAIEATNFKEPRVPVYQNVNALPERDPAAIKSNLLSQLTQPVRWTQTILRMIQDGASEFTEIGPGTVLQGLVGKISATYGEFTITGIQ